MKKLILFFLGIVLLLSGCKKTTNSTKQVKIVKTIIIKTFSTSLVRTFPGNVKSSNKTNLSFKTSGRLSDLYIKDGQKVQKGELIATLESDEQKYKLEAVKAHLFKAEADYERYKTLYEKDYVAKADYELKKKDFEILKSALNIVQKNLEDTAIRAPFSGVITRKIADNHDFINAKEAIAVLQDLNKLEIEINIPEKLMVFENSNFSYSAEFENFPNKKIPLRLKSFSKQKDKMTNTYLATFYVKNNENIPILPDMTATVTIKSNIENNSGIKVPINAVFSDSDKKQYVWAVNAENIAVKTPVEIKEFINNKALISSGLEKNTRIIISGIHHILEGDKIKEYERLDLDK